MSLTTEQIAEAFSRHDFASTYPYFADDARWENIGGHDLEGRTAIIAACDQAAAHLAQVTTDFVRFRMTSAPAHVIIESIAHYTSATHPPAIVASCDIYRFDGGMLVEVTSYNIELKTLP